MEIFNLLIQHSHSTFVSIGVIFGVIITKVLTNSQKFRELKLDEATQMRHEYRVRCEKLEVENDEWKSKFYTETTQLKEQIMILTSHIKALESKLDDLTARHAL